MEDEPLYLREEALCGFEAAVGYENGRLPVGDGDSIPMVQLRGPGTVVASVPAEVTALEVTEGRSTALRALAVLGWIGRVVPRGLLPSEAPGGLRGFVAPRWPVATRAHRARPTGPSASRRRGASAPTGAGRCGRTHGTSRTCSRSCAC
jgi:hypothetical protein